MRVRRCSRSTGRYRGLNIPANNCQNMTIDYKPCDKIQWLNSYTFRTNVSRRPVSQPLVLYCMLPCPCEGVVIGYEVRRSQV
jgi:hypothetical protein